MSVASAVVGVAAGLVCSLSITGTTFTATAWLADGRVVLLTSGPAGESPDDRLLLTRAGIDRHVAARTDLFESASGQAATSGFHAGQAVHLGLPGVGAPLVATPVTVGFFETLDVEIEGRSFRAEDEDPGAPLVGIASQSFWSRLRQREPYHLGSVILTTPKALRIVGVAPRGFEGLRLGERTDVWIPSGQIPALARRGMFRSGQASLLAIARLRPGVSPDAAARSLATSSSGVFRQSGELQLVPVARLMGTNDAGTTVLREDLLMIVVGLCAFLIAVSAAGTLRGLILSRGTRYGYEREIRLALGASPWALRRALGPEMGGMVVVGIPVGILATTAISSALARVEPMEGVAVAQLASVSITRAISMVGAVAVALVTCGYLPALWLGGRDSTTSGVGGGRAASRVLLEQAAIAVALAVSALVFNLAVQHALSPDSGIRRRGLIFAEVQIGSSYRSARADHEAIDRELAASAEEFRRRLLGLSGVAVVAEGRVPIGARARISAAGLSMVADSEGQRQTSALIARAGSRYFEAIGVPFVEGGTFSEDGETSRRQVVVTEAAARELWPAQGHRVGRQVRIGRTVAELTGVVQDFLHGSELGGLTRVVYLAPDTSGRTVQTTVEVAVRHSGEAGAVKSAIHELMVDMFPSSVGRRVSSASDLYEADVWRQRLGGILLTSAAAAVAATAVIGICVSVWYGVWTRRREIGIRMALGASVRDVVVSNCNVLLIRVGVGSALGGLLGWLVCKSLASSIQGVDAKFAVAMMGSACGVLLAVVAAVGSLYVAILPVSGSRQLRRLWDD